MPRDSDERVEVLQQCVEGLLTIRDKQVLHDALRDSKDVQSFFDDVSCMRLILTTADKNVMIGTDLTQLNTNSTWILIVKTAPSIITPDNILSTITIHTMHGTPASNLLNTLENFWAPTFLESTNLQQTSSSSSSSSQVPENFKQSLINLKEILSSNINEISSSNTKETEKFLLYYMDINSLNDEIHFWQNLTNNRKSFYYTMSCDIMKILNSPSIIKLSTNDFHDIHEYIELIKEMLNILNDLYSCSTDDGIKYPQLRMEHLLNLISRDIISYCQKYLIHIDIWKISTKSTLKMITKDKNIDENEENENEDDENQIQNVRMKLNSSIDLLNTWNNILDDFIKYWRGYNRWKVTEISNKDSLVKLYSLRLEQVNGVISLADELAAVLPRSDWGTIDWNRLYDPLKSTQPFLFNPYTKDNWDVAVREFQKQVDPVDEVIASQFRKRVGNNPHDPMLILDELQKCSNSYSRPAVLRSLTPERELLLSLLRERLDVWDSALDADDHDRPRGKIRSAGHVSSPIVSNIVRLIQIETRISEIISSSRIWLQDLNGYDSYLSRGRDLEKRASGEVQRLYKSWKNNAKDMIESGDEKFSLNVSMTSIVDGMLVVNFSNELVTLIRDYRQLSELNVISRASYGLGRGKKATITDIVMEAENRYRYGMLLKKTATFYNSIGEQIIGIQKNLLHNSFVAFNRLVVENDRTTGGRITWNQTADIETFTKNIQIAVEKLSQENRALRRIHVWLTEMTINLMKTDLTRQYDTWRSIHRSMKEKISDISSKYGKSAMEWIKHWDHQVYKALEVGLQVGLVGFTENMTEMKADIIISQRELDFKPSLTDLRRSYFTAIRKFIMIPSKLDTFGHESAHLFRQLSSKSSVHMVAVMRAMESLFAHLKDTLTRYQEWSLFSGVDLDSTVERHVKTAEQFAVNFKLVRNKRKELERLPDMEKVGCVTISLVSLKTTVEESLEQLNDALLIHLRRSLTEEFREVDQFLENAAEKLKKTPQKVSEIGDAKKQWKELDSSREAMMSLSRGCVEKKALLVQFSAGSMIDVSEILSRMSNLDGEGGRWDDFDISMEAHNDIMEKQKGVLCTQLEEEEVTINMEVEKLSTKWKQLKPDGELEENASPESIDAIFNALDDWKSQFETLEQRTVEHAGYRHVFNMRAPRFDGLESLMEDLKTTMQSWEVLKEFLAAESAMADEDWISFPNIYALQDLAVEWLEKLKQIYARGTYDSVATFIATKCENLKRSMASLKYCKSDAFKDDHWTELLQGRLGLPRELDRTNLKVRHMLSCLKVLMDPATLSFVKNLQARALGEVQIREGIRELRNWELSAEVKFLTQEESGRTVPLIKEWKDIFLEIGDKQSLLGSLKESPFFKAFADVGNSLEGKMSILDTVLHTLNSIQRKWLYLEPIFSRGALPGEESRFRRVDEGFKDVMNTLSRDPKLFYLADEAYFPRLADNLRHQLDQLERCQKALTEFLEAKRSAMPRFYFIGDDDLLEILGQARNPAVIQTHLKKLFQGIHRVQFDADHRHIIAMVSSANEVVELVTPIAVNEKVEDWLERLASEMRVTLAALLERCLSTPRLDWKYPSQVLCLARAIRFTQQAEEAIPGGKDSLIKLRDDLDKELRDYTSHDLSGEPLLQLKMKSLVFDLVHYTDVIQQLIKKKTSRLHDWQWSKQLRYYFTTSRGAVVRMHDAEFAYTYEYQGNAPKLVHTPLTDKCYLTLTQGMKMGFGGNPYGPAGTGKTESVKALAACLGRQVLVFNCDEALESTSMVRIFIGIVKCGAWGCFDEFNRLKEDQLSAISQQIQLIQDAIKTKNSPISLLGRSVEVDFNSGIFVTLNPAGKGYGGRSRLPDNLKALFRPVAMGAPDNELIAEVSLVTEGFTQSKDLASKIVSLFTLSRQLLSVQQHYDWGLRSLKAVLNSGGRLIQNTKVNGTQVTPELEYELLIKAVRVNTLSKLTFADTSKFLALIGDVFPGVKSADLSGGELEEAIRSVMVEKPFYLVEDAGQIKKMLQLKEAIDQRMGCVVVGPSGCGKSTLWRILKAAMIKCGEPVVTYVMNPKSMPRERLLGRMNVDTNEWTDGVLTDAARQVVKESSNVRCWIICDGDVDPEWIESLNSVLDDNHLLTLPNGERISFGNNVNFLFETHDLQYASPATVSRMGMIFLSNEDVDVKRLLQKWLSTVDGERRMAISAWLDEFFLKALDFVLQNEAVVETTLVGTVMNGLSQLRDVTTKQEFLCALIRGLGGNLSLQRRASLATSIFQWSAERPPELGQPLDCYADGSALIQFTLQNVFDGASGSVSKSRGPRGGSMLDEIAPPTVRDIGAGCVVPTVSVQRTLATLDQWIEHSDPFLLVGPEGCGKNMIIQHAFRRRRNVAITTLHCNAQTSSNDVISKIAQTCNLFSATDGRVYRPRDCERLVLYLKDINLPRPDMYDTCQLIAFLQQLITFGGFYDENLEFLRLEKVQIVGSINSASTVGRHPLSTRFTAVVRILVVDYPETSELTAVYDAFLKIALENTDLVDSRWKSTVDRERLASALVELYQKTCEKFTVDDCRHYLFTPRDITQLVRNLCRYPLHTDSLLDILCYEASRLFRDRIVGTDAVSRFDQVLGGVMRTSFRHTLPSQEIYYTALSLGGGPSAAKSEGKDAGGEESTASLVGGTFSKMDNNSLQKLIAQGVVYYEREERDLNLLLFPEALEHITHVDRVLSSHGGHCLLIGKNGVGRRNAATIAAYMLGYSFVTPAITRDYSTKQFVNTLKNVLDIAGVRGDPVVLLLEDFQITSEALLEIVNSLICAGEAPGLYTNEELEPIMKAMRAVMEDSDGSARTPYEMFIQRVRKNLHVVLCMDPAHPKFLYRTESNPALYAQCSVLWIGEWKTQSLREIPLMIDGIKDLICGVYDAEDAALGGASVENSKRSGGESKRGGESKYESKSGSGGELFDDEEGASNQLTPKAELLEALISIHASVTTDLQASPKDYLSFLKNWYSVYNLKRKDVLSELGHLQAGLSKLDSAAQIVHDLRTNAAQQEKDLRVAQAAADRAMEDISKAILSSTDRRNEVGEVKRTVAENEARTQERKKEIEGELAEIEPVLLSAKEAVGGIRANDLHEIRSLQAPPEAVADVLAAVLTLLGQQDVSWQSMKKFLGSRGVKDDILNFDPSRISHDLRKNVLKMLSKKKSSFDEATITRASVAAAPMATWVKANIRYSLVMEKIEPLRQELEVETTKLEQSQKHLRRCEDELQEIDDRVAQLKKEFASRTAEAERLKANLALAGTTLDKAENLINQLSGEQIRWKTQAGQLSSDLARLPMKMMIAAGFITYLARTSEDIRANMLTKWQSVTLPSPFIFKRIMSTESELLQWKGLGLPSDDLSQENGLVITYGGTERVPFIIDPASAATEWLRSTLSSNKNHPLEVVTQFDVRFMNQVELAVRFGKTLLVLEADGLDPSLYPLCRKDLFHQGPRYVVNVGEKTVDYNEGFRLYLVTRNPFPEIPPDAAALLNIVNFTVTRSGLEGQLLGQAIQHEQPELEAAKGEMLRREEDFKVQLARMERDLLQALATAEGNLLENTSLIESLTNTKMKSAEIEEALAKSAEASLKLDQQREVYRPFALAGARLYFLVKSLQSICHMYQFSLSSFLHLFKASLASGVANSAKTTEEKLATLAADLEVRVLFFVGRALFKADRPMFALHLVRGMHPENFQTREWEVFTGAYVASVSDTVPKGYPSWASADRKDAFRLLAEQLPHLVSALELENTAKWQRFASSLEAERDLPSLRGVTNFQRVLIIQAFRPDRLQSSILQFCIDLLKIDSISPPPTSMQSLFDEINSQTPLLVISSPGADPSKELQEYASSAVGMGSFEELAMGGGQQDIAIQMLRSAAQNGTWLCLKNLHLVVAWLPVLEKELSALTPHDDFRLIMTSEAHSQFTSILLQTSLKSTYESPPGLKKNLQRTFDSWQSASDTLFNPKEAIRGRLLFLLAAFHAVMQERRTYIPQGWSKFYEFSYGDLKAGTYVMEAVTEQLDKKNNGALDWEVIHGLMVDAIYGGRIDNPYDARVLKAYLNIFFCEELTAEKSAGRAVIENTPLRMPSSTDLLAFKNVVTKMEDSDSPFMFCLPDNIERSLQRNLSSSLIRQLQLIASSDTTTQSYDREKWRQQLGPVIELWNQLVSATPNVVGKRRENVTAPASRKVLEPVDDFVHMEYELAGDICAAVDTSLRALKHVLFGSGLLTSSIQETAAALLSGEVPNDWRVLFDAGPEKPQNWLRELVRKRVALGKWVAMCSKGGSGSTLLSVPLSLHDLFHPSTFLNALRQQTARTLQVSMDNLKMICQWGTTSVSGKNDFSRIGEIANPIATLTNLRLQGGLFNSGLLEFATPDGSEVVSVSDVAIAFVPLKTNELYRPESVIGVPVYSTISREDLLMELPMPMSQPDIHDRWILTGVALLLTDED